MTTSSGAIPIAHVVRSGVVESVHLGHVVIIDPDGAVIASWGDPEAVMFPRSSNKPAQASALVGLGLELPGELRALTAASHSGEQPHLDGVRAILASVGLDIDALATPPDVPYGAAARRAWYAEGRGNEALAMNCSGKHAGMIAAARLNGDDITSYLDPQHPVQRACTEEITRLSGSDAKLVGTDGCGAPVIGMTLTQLARMFSLAVQLPEDDPARQVADAMRAHPYMVGGTDRDVTALMNAVPGALAKDGAEGVYAVSLDSGYAVALKVLDGADRARSVVMAQALTHLGVVGIDDFTSIPITGGGRPVGELVGVLARG